MEYFIDNTSQVSFFLSEGNIRCPCIRHKNTTSLIIDKVKLDLFHKGFQPKYWYWTLQGEFEVHINVKVGTSMIYVLASSRYEIGDQYEEMTYDATTAPFIGDIMKEQPNEVAPKFYELLKVAQQLLSEGCNIHTELSMVVIMLSIKIS